MEPRMLRTSDPGGEKPFDLVEVRLRPLLRIQRKWKKNSASDMDEEMKNTFSHALKDGFVLCEFINTLHSNPVIRPDPRESVNIDKFLSQCSDDGLSADELFMQGDIAAATNNSLTRVARTIIALDKTADASTSQKANLQALMKFSKDGLNQRTKSASAEISCLETWVDRYIASRSTSVKTNVRYGVESSSEGVGHSKLPMVRPCSSILDA
ncbi:hypothetical protein K435DRAFT_91671 [Dendrothele bispora CBS 962.96]|uniref:Uncharacterized protein n=1 Tax=Dendrothele bispora (strain CBS 962.96) TaxID=1314807 RepID=A0A4S8MRB9_DENBC|nr:hypothetical protein K435DRAFT_91671 [Dendrothele bispora CBS 962.96]